jgi:hypothetical protein
MFHIYTKFHIHNSDGTLVITIKLKAKENFQNEHTRHNVLQLINIDDAYSKKIYCHIKNNWFQYDGAPAHCTNVVFEYLDETFEYRRFGRGGQITWPPHSPDLTPLDFFLCGYMQSQVYETPVETQHDLVARIQVAAGTIREMPGIFQRVQHNLARRCRTWNEAGRRHFEQLL